VYEQALRLSIDGLSSKQGSLGKNQMIEASFFSLGFRDFKSACLRFLEGRLRKK